MPIDVERSGHVATITLNRPEVLNAFNTDHLSALRSAIDQLSGDHEVRAVILTGAGERAFAAGADIAEMRTKSPSEALAFSAMGHGVCRAIEAARQPYIAAVNGFALGGGCEIALACDIRLASENAALGQPEVTLGILPGWGGTQRLTRLVGSGIARELIYTGRRVKADEAARLGMVNAVYPSSELMGKAMEMAELIAGNAPIAVSRSKDAISRALDVELDTGLEFEAKVFALSFDTSDQKEGMGAFLERRKATFTGQ
ncbi:MAG: enoyl-CoA hydratase-related protein [Nitrolancea sp.]